MIVAISAVASSYASQVAAAASRPQAQKTQPRENDGDSDDKKAASVPSNTPASSGAVGTIVNTTA
jgi:hypothetical protein